MTMTKEQEETTERFAKIFADEKNLFALKKALDNKKIRAKVRLPIDPKK